MTERTWTNIVTNESIGNFPEEWSDDYEFRDLICPKCGKKAEYNEGQIGEDERGNSIEICWWRCNDCAIDSSGVEL